MDHKDRTSEDRDVEPKSGAGKKPYHKPSFRFERVFETMALSCGKVSRLQKTCKGMRKSS
jgi:hypothetical protein